MIYDVYYNKRCVTRDMLHEMKTGQDGESEQVLEGGRLTKRGRVEDEEQLTFFLCELMEQTGLPHSHVPWTGEQRSESTQTPPTVSIKPVTLSYSKMPNLFDLIPLSQYNQSIYTLCPSVTSPFILSVPI